MSVALAGTWRPRGEISRCIRLYPLWMEVYEQIYLSVPPDTEEAQLEMLAAQPRLTLVASPERGWGRYLAVQAALEGSARHLHLADVDRLLRWTETRPEEWRFAVQTVQTTDCLIIGRTEAALRTHPRAIRDTEVIINTLFSHLLGLQVDLGGGSRGFSRPAAEHLIARTSPAGGVTLSGRSCCTVPA